MKNKLIDFTTDFINLFYPNICLGCGDALQKKEKFLCLSCLHQLPRTNFHNIEENPIEKKFYGKSEIQAATSFLFFEKDSITQKILHAIKYHGQKELGVMIGSLFGEELRKNKFKQVDTIIPVPLHPNKLKTRGYNQSEQISYGIANAMQKNISTNTLKRVIENPTQTKKGVYERWENTAGIFQTQNAEELKNKHILLVDDVITTGSTVEACIIPLQKIPGIKISVASLAAVI